jgi:hypothetical protein
MKGLLVFAIVVRRSRRASMERAPATLAMVLMERGCNWSGRTALYYHLNALLCMLMRLRKALPQLIKAVYICVNKYLG